MIRFRYQPTFEDWFTLNRVLAVRQFRFLIGLAILLLCLFLIYPFVLAAVGHDEDGALTVYRKNLAVLFVPGITCLLLAATYFAVRKRWNVAGELREEREFVIDENGVHMTAASVSGHLDWQHIKHVEVKGGLFMLKTAQNQFYYFPVSVVPDAALLNDLLSRKVRAKKG